MHDSSSLPDFPHCHMIIPYSRTGTGRYTVGLIPSQLSAALYEKDSFSPIPPLPVHSINLVPINWGIWGEYDSKVPVHNINDGIHIYSGGGPIDCNRILLSLTDLPN